MHCQTKPPDAIAFSA